MQEEMYDESLRILKDLELDLYNKKKLSEQKERELKVKERDNMLQEERWKRQERELETAFRERLKIELEQELVCGLQEHQRKLQI